MVSLLLTVLVDKYHVRCLKIYKLYVHADWCKRKKNDEAYAFGSFNCCDRESSRDVTL